MGFWTRWHEGVTRQYWAVRGLMAALAMGLVAHVWATSGTAWGLVTGGVVLALAWFAGTFDRTQFQALRQLEGVREQMLAARSAAEDEHARARRAASALDEARDELLRTTSHELRTPLTSLAGALELLRERDADLTPARRAGLLNVAQRSVDELTYLTEQVLDLVRLSERPRGRERVRANLDEIVHRRLARHDRQLEHHLVNVDVEPGLEVVVDVTATERMVDNLLSNASRYTPPGTVIRVLAGRDGDRIRFSVHDEGPGLPSEVVERLGEPLVRGRGTDSVGRGLGVGFALVTRHARAQGGRFELDTGPEGTVATVTLPAAAPTGARVGAGAQASDDPA